MSLADIRLSSKASKERSRQHNHKAKWGKGVRPLPGTTTVREDGRCRPNLKLPDDRATVPRPCHSVLMAARKPALRLEVEEAIAWRHQPDAVEYGDDYSTASNVLYSFDADRSPEGHANQVLSVAITRALDRFETKETEKIVREYEFVDDQSVADDSHEDTDEDGFELV